MPSEENGTELDADREAMAVMRAAADIVQHRRPALDPATAVESQGLLLLSRAALDVGDADRTQLEPARRLELLDRSLRALEPAMQVARAHDADWLRTEFATPVHRIRSEIQRDAARRRVNQAILLSGETEVAEIPFDGLSEENVGAYARVLLHGVDRLLDTYAVLDEQIDRIGRERFEPAFDGMKARWGSEMLPMDRGRFKDVGGARSALVRFRQLLEPAHRDPAQATESPDSFTDLVQVAIATTGGLATLAAAIAACVAELGGELQVAAELTTIASAPALELAHVVAAIDLVHGVVLVLDATPSADAKLHSALEIGAGMAWFAGAGVDSPRVGGAISGLIAVGYLIGLADLAVQAGVSSGAAALRLRFAFMAHHSVVIRERSAALVKALLLLERASEPGQHQALSQVVEEVTADLDLTTSSFLDACLRADSVGPACPGGEPHLRDAFAPLHELLGPSAGPGEALHKATVLVARISEVLDDAGRYARLAGADEPH